MRLLLIEDNETLSALLQKGLSAAGFAVDVIKTVADALNGLAMTRFSAIILDLGLPDGDGYSVLQFLRGKGDSTPVLILTARSAVDDRVKGFQRGADDYLCKPFALEELIARRSGIVAAARDIAGRGVAAWPPDIRYRGQGGERRWAPTPCSAARSRRSGSAAAQERPRRAEAGH